MSSRLVLAALFLALGLLSGVAISLKPEHMQDTRTPLVWTTDPNPQRDPQVRSFNELNPEYRLRIDPDNSGVMKVVVQCSAGMGPDLIDHINEGSYQTYVEAGILWDLTEQATKLGFGPETLHPAVRPLVMLPVLTKEGTVEDRQFVYPCNIFHTFIIYNKTVFDKYDIPYPSEDMTWDEYIDIAKKLTIMGENRVIPEVFGAAGANPNVIIWGMGGDFMNQDGTRCTLDDKRVVDAMKFWHDLYYKHGVEPSPSQKAGVQSQGGWAGGYMSWFGEGKVGMYWGARWMLIQFRRFLTEQKKMREEWRAANPGGDEKDAPPLLRLGACLVPRFKDSKRYTVFGARCTGINVQSPRRDDALKFMQYLAGPVYSKHINMGADSKPGNVEYYQMDLMRNPEWPDEEAVHETSLKATPDGRIAPRSLFIQNATLNRYFDEAKQKMISESEISYETVQKLMEDVARTVNVEMTRNVQRNPHLMKAYKALLKQGAEPMVFDPEGEAQ